MAFAILADEGLGFRVRQIMDALLGTEVEFDPDALVCGIEEAVRVAAEAMHVTEALRNASIAHDDSDLVQRLRQQCPEVPIIVGATHTGARIALDGVIAEGVFQRDAGECADLAGAIFDGVRDRRDRAGFQPTRTRSSAYPRFILHHDIFH
jgi:hypothetical protein